ncbi:MurR/RpiR family transcriptional regulator [Enterococcus sp. HY326]|uniref:MurR/RpiR family transcriptional regulator n=1 Tax=Enterococcus sp. HY326 TaxID=2971265 RepID=UPI00223F4B2A|nr:MurR/RpiR family transcriptional regulator [Enterococcus sp. HY326]
MDPISKIYAYYNTEGSQATYYKLADFVLKNIKRLPNLSITQFAEETYVSKATITRFIHFLGLESYQEFKKYFGRITGTSKLSFLKLTTPEVKEIQMHPDNFLKQYTQQIITMIQDTAETMNISEIDSLIKAVQTANQVAFLGYSDSNSIAKDIQLGCLAIGKTIEVAESQKKFDDILERFGEQDLVIILSNYGNFFTHHKIFYDELIAKEVPLILVTQNYSSMESFRFQQTIYLTTKRQLNIGNYPMRIFSEYFVRRILLQP